MLFSYVTTLVLLMISTVSALKAKEEIINGRIGTPLYKIDVPDNWQKLHVPPSQDTMLPIAEFKIRGIKIVFHNFPGIPIPPQAQVERWKRQHPARFIEPQSFSGFQGLLYETDTTLAWALEWAACKKNGQEYFSDVTIKITGPADEIEQERETLIQVARSLENLEDLCQW